MPVRTCKKVDDVDLTIRSLIEPLSCRSKKFMLNYFSGKLSVPGSLSVVEGCKFDEDTNLVVNGASPLRNTPQEGASATRGVSGASFLLALPFMRVGEGKR